jgi:hypothetical protein
VFVLLPVRRGSKRDDGFEDYDIAEETPPGPELAGADASSDARSVE